MGKRLIALLLLVVTVAAMLPACGSSSDSKTYKISVSLPFTGEVAYTGTFMKKGIDVAVEDINKSGGILGKQIEIVYEDDKGDPKEAALVADKIEAGKPNAVIGPYSSVTTVAAAPIYQEAGILELSPTATATELTQKGYKTFIRVIWDDERESKYFAKYVKNFWPTKKLWVLHDGSAFPLGWTNSFVKFAKELGLTVNVEQINPQDKDYASVLTKLKGAGAEVVVMMTYYNQAGLLTKQGFDMGVPWQWVGCEEFNSEAIKIAGTASVQNLLFFTPPPVPADLPYAETKAFGEKYQAKYGNGPENPLPLVAADALYVLKAGVEGAKSTDPQKVADYIKTKLKNYPGLFGPIASWDSTGNPDRGGFMMYTVDKAGTIMVASKDKQLP